MSFSDPAYNIEQLELQSGMKVADLGCGSGFYAISAGRAVGDKGRIFAVDVLKDLLDRLKKEASRQGVHNIEVVWGNIEQVGGTKLKDESMDAVIVANVLFQAENKKGLAQETKRILKTKGKLLLIDWHDSYGGIGPHKKDVVDRKTGREIFESLGFSFERDIRAGSHHWGVILRKV